MVRPLEDGEIPAAFDDQKKERDLRRLLRLVEFTRSERCRRAWLNDYFGVEGGPESCAACDRCVDPEEWLAAHLAAPQASALAVGAPAVEADRTPRRGDFVRVDGRWLGRVRRVHEERAGARVEVELSTTLRTRTFSTRRHRIEVLPGGEGQNS